MASCIGLDVHRSGYLPVLRAKKQHSGGCSLRPHCSGRRDSSRFWKFFGLILHKTIKWGLKVSYASMEFPEKKYATKFLKVVLFEIGVYGHVVIKSSMSLFCFDVLFVSIWYWFDLNF